MPQSNVIFFYLFAAFFVFITLRGELRKYMGFLFSSPTGPQVSRGADLGPATANPNNTSPDWQRLGQIAKVASLA